MDIPLLSTTQYEYGDIVEEKLADAGYDVLRILKKLPADKLKDQIPSNADVAIVAYYGAIIPQEIIDIFPKGLLNIHPSLLPKYRGPSPAASAILNGNKTTGVTIFKLDEKMDHGPIVAQRSLPVYSYDTRHTFLKRLFSTGAEVLVNILPDYLEGKIEPTPQNHSQATYTQMLTKEDGRVNWDASDKKIERQIRALTPWPGAWTKLNGKRVLINKAHLDKADNLIIDEFQIAGKTAVTGSWDRSKFLAYLS